MSVASYPDNLSIYYHLGDDMDPKDTAAWLKGFGKDHDRAPITTFHATNGVFDKPAELVVPTLLAGFQHAVDVENNLQADSPLIIAINSNDSVADIMSQKGTPELADKIENQYVRAEKIGIPLARQFPEKNVIVILYSETTPNALYEAIAKAGMKGKTLIKWGYGTTPNQGIIEGAEFFEKTFAHPLPNDTRPVCADITPTTGQKGNVSVVDLREPSGPFNQRYISPKNECLFRLGDPELRMQYGERGNPRSESTPPAYRK